MNPNGYSSTVVAGGSFGDVWSGEMDDGAKVAIKCLRLYTITKDHAKSLKVCYMQHLCYVDVDLLLYISVPHVRSTCGRKRSTQMSTS